VKHRTGDGDYHMAFAVDTSFPVNDQAVFVDVDPIDDCGLTVAGAARYRREQHGDGRAVPAIGMAGAPDLRPQLHLALGRRHFERKMSGVGTTVHDRGQQKSAAAANDVARKLGQFNSNTHYLSSYKGG